MWPQRWLGELYSHLRVRYQRETFGLQDIASIVGSETKARVAVSRLRRMGLIYVFAVAGRKKRYITAHPCMLPYIASGRIANLYLIKQSAYARLVGIFSVEALEAYPTIRSIIVYGSLSRGAANKYSDVDLLIIMESDKSVGERIQQLLQLESVGRTGEELDWLDENGTYTNLAILPLTRDEVMEFPPILLDILEDGIPIVDDGTFINLGKALTQSLVETGARREVLSPNDWYWDLKPTLKTEKVLAA